MSTYPTYKPSGIEWLGDIPEHWAHRRLKDYCYVNMGQSPGSESYNDDGDGLPFYQGNADFGELHPVTRIHCTDPKKIAESNDVLISVRAPVGEMNIADAQCCIGRGLAAVQPTTVVDKFLYYQLIVIKEELKLYVTGSTFEAVSSGDISVLRFLKPPKDEQTAIANYLDEKTSKLDQLISNKKTQIDKLKEIRQIEINTAVTKGLDPNVTLKPSGIEWLGDIPEHWEVKRFKDFTKILSGFAPEQFEFVDDGSTYYKVDDLNYLQNSFDLYESTWKVNTDLNLYPEEIILIPKRGAAIGTNKVSIAKRESVFDTNLMGLQLNSTRANVRYICFLIKMRELEELADTSTIPQINNKHIYPIKTVLPPIKEQTAIANYLDEKTSRIDKLVRNLENQIEQLEEIRKIEIYNAVTGKIKVA